MSRPLSWVWTTVAIAAMAFLSSACHLQPTARRWRVDLAPTAPVATWEECMSYDRGVVGWTATGVVLGVLGGSSGITTAILDQHTPRYITGGISVTLGAVTALSGYLSNVYAKKYTDRCTDNHGGK